MEKPRPQRPGAMAPERRTSSSRLPTARDGLVPAFWPPAAAATTGFLDRMGRDSRRPVLARPKAWRSPKGEPLGGAPFTGSVRETQLARSRIASRVASGSAGPEAGAGTGTAARGLLGGVD